MDYLEPGRILHLYCELQGRIGKRKFLVLADADEECLFFVINSQINDFVRNRLSLMQAQIAMKARDYGFLQHDSWLACHEPYFIDRAEVLRQINEDPGGALRGHIDDALRRKILKVVASSPTLVPIDKTLVRQALGR